MGDPWTGIVKPWEARGQPVGDLYFSLMYQRETHGRSVPDPWGPVRDSWVAHGRAL